MVLELPATLHTMAIGVSTDHACLYQEIDVQQRFRKKNTPMWKLWGPLCAEKNSGLTLSVIKNMAKHADLPGIIALDTFVGNADRSPPNLFYDEIADRFYGIDMAAGFSSPLASEACRQLQTMDMEQFSCEDLVALNHYAQTLELLIRTWPPERQVSELLKLAHEAGIKERRVSL